MRAIVTVLSLPLVFLLLVACGQTGPYGGRDHVVPPVRTAGSPIPTALATWECEGPVYDCSAKDLEPSHCEAISHPGNGDTEDEARDEGREQCQVDLHIAKGGEWKCKDGSKLRCKPATWKWKCAGPVPGCKCSNGPGECPYVEGFGGEEEYARGDALTTCEELINKKCVCDDDSQLMCTEGSYPTARANKSSVK